MCTPDILEIDLSKESVKRYSRPKLFEEWLGGVGAGINLLNEHVSPDVDPLDQKNVLVFLIGSLTTFYPVISKTVVLFRSPLTGDLGESYAGGRLSLAMRFAGLGAIIIKGKAERSSFITITNDDVQILNAGPLSRMFTNTIGRVLREKIPIGSGRRSSVRIGPASENGVRYGNIIVDSFRHFGRLGAGTIMGSKNLKAIIITGEKDIPLDSDPINYKGLSRTYKRIWNECVKTTAMRKYHVLGTPENILPLNELNALPTRNFKKSRFDKAEGISGEKFVESYLGRRVSCNTCPVGCIHVAILRERYGKDSPADIHTLAVPYDFELLYALGSNLEIGNGLDVLKLIEQTERLGMDAITTGVVLGWLAEAFEKELITKDDTNGLEIRFGNVDSFIEAIKRIASRDSNNKDIFWYAGEGLNALVKKYGGNDFAIMINSHPPAGYSTGPYTILGHYIGARHSHLDNAGYSLDQKALNKHYTPQQAVEWLLKEEEWRNVLNSLVACLFARKIYTPELVVECLSNIGISKSQEELLELGRKIQKLRIETKLKFGMDYPRSMASLPKRFFQMPTAHGKIPEKLIKEKLYSSFRKTAKERYNIQI